MRTGMRWVTLTQLPVAFCAGISANSRAGRRADRVEHGPRSLTPG